MPDRQDPAYKKLCQAAVDAFLRAARAMPDEWQYHFYHGKMAAKAGEECPM